MVSACIIYVIAQFDDNVPQHFPHIPQLVDDQMPVNTLLYAYMSSNLLRDVKVEIRFISYV